MNKNIILIFLVLFLIPIVIADVSYPVAELGNCGSEKECETYCEEITNIKDCINFAEENDLMTKEELSKAKKFLPLMLSGETPGECSSRKECDEYCSQEGNLEECIKFALKVGDISEKEAEMARKTGGKGPGGCKGPIECDAYCNKDENFNECIDFAKEYGLIDEEEYEMAKKTGGKGPGGCKGKEECDAYCEEHQQECMDWAKEHGLNMGEEEHKPESKEEECMIKCMKENNINFDECGPNSMENEKCKKCAEECMQYYEGPCLTEKEWEEKEAECRSKGEHMEAKPIIGDDGEGNECDVDVECIDRSDEWEDMPEETPEGEGISESEGTPESPEEESTSEEETSSEEFSGDETGASITGESIREDKGEGNNIIEFIKKLLGLN